MGAGVVVELTDPSGVDGASVVAEAGVFSMPIVWAAEDGILVGFSSPLNEASTEKG